MGGCIKKKKKKSFLSLFLGKKRREDVYSPKKGWRREF